MGLEGCAWGGRASNGKDEYRPHLITQQFWHVLVISGTARSRRSASWLSCSATRRGGSLPQHEHLPVILGTTPPLFSRRQSHSLAAAQRGFCLHRRGSPRCDVRQAMQPGCANAFGKRWAFGVHRAAEKTPYDHRYSDAGIKHSLPLFSLHSFIEPIPSRDHVLDREGRSPWEIGYPTAMILMLALFIRTDKSR